MPKRKVRKTAKSSRKPVRVTQLSFFRFKVFGAALLVLGAATSVILLANNKKGSVLSSRYYYNRTPTAPTYRLPTPTPASQEYWTQDQITSVSRFPDLPYDIKVSLDREYYQSSIKSGVKWIPSTVSRQALNTLGVANFVSKVAGGVIAAIDGGKDKVIDWFAEEIAKFAASSVIATMSNDATADITITLYDAKSLNSKVQFTKKTFKALKKTLRANPTLAAEAAAWLLQAEMAYINANVSEGFRTLAGKGQPLEVYVVGIEGENKNDKMCKGLKFYYRVGSGSFSSNFSDVVCAEASASPSR